MNRYLLLACLFFSLHGISFSQSVPGYLEELEVKLAMADQPGKLEILLRLGQEYPSFDAAKGIRYTKQAIALATEQKDSLSLANALFTLGNILHHHTANYDSALATYLEAVKLFESRDVIKAQRARRAIASTYSEVDNYSQALKYLLDAELALQTAGDSTELALAKQDIGTLYLNLDQLESAKRKLTEALAIFAFQKQAEQAGQTKNLIAKYYLAQGQFEEAEKTLTEALAYFEATGSSDGLGQTMLLKGELALRQNSLQKAKNYWQQAAASFQLAHNLPDLVKTKHRLGSLAITQTQYSQADTLLREAQSMAYAINDRRLLKDTFELLFQLNSARGNLELAEFYKEKFIAIGDFVFKEENERQMAEMQARFDIDQKERELALLRSQNEVQRLTLKQQSTERNFFLILALLFLLFAAAAVYFWLRIRRSNTMLNAVNQQIQHQNEELETLNGTKDKFFSIIAHDLKGPLASLRSFANLLINYTDSLSKEEIQNLATDLDSSLKNLFSLLENLLTWARSQTGGLNFEPADWPLKKVTEETLQVLEATAQKKHITLTHKVPENFECHADRNMITTVIRNLVSNALKFTEEKGTVSITVDPYVDAYEIAVKDTGVGMPPAIKAKLFKVGEKVTTKGTANEKGTGLGLLLCKEFVEMNGGTIWVESKEGEGSTFRFTIPKAT